MATMRMRNGLYVGGGINRASSYADALANANSLIIVILNFNNENSNRNITFTIPKDQIASDAKVFVSGAYHTDQRYVWAQVTISTNDCVPSIFFNGTLVQTGTNIYYYYD